MKIRYQPTYCSFQSIYLLSISLIGLFFLLILFLWAPTTQSINSFQKTVILFIFYIICILGIIAANYPKSCTSVVNIRNYRTNIILEKEDREEFKDKSDKILIKFEGHHPDCGNFKSHTFNLWGKKYCAGCTGLWLGAVIAIILSLMYYLDVLGDINGQIMFWVGVGSVTLALSLIIFINISHNLLKFFSNLILVLGALFILLGIDTVKGNFLLELYVIILIFLWIYTRIHFSQNNHLEICNRCGKKNICKDF